MLTIISVTEKKESDFFSDLDVNIAVLKTFSSVQE